MTHGSPKNPSAVSIRPVQYRDLETVDRLLATGLDDLTCSINPDQPLLWRYPRPWNRVLTVISLLNPMQHRYGAYLAEQHNKIQAVIRVSPFNRARTTWRVDRVVVDTAIPPEADAPPQERSTKTLSSIGSQLLRHCFEAIWEARTWLLEVDINDKETLALYRQNGFQPLAHLTYWTIASELLQELAEREPDLPNLLPVSNADAQLLYQLDTASMPPLVRQVFDRHILDFKTSLVGSLMEGLKNWLSHTEIVSGYVFESQRKAAIGYFQIRLCRAGAYPHQAQLTVHPAYTWLYPELLAQMSRLTQDVPAQALELVSSDYQPEREEYLERVGATRSGHALMMSRSVWHKVRETRPSALEGLQLAEVLQGLKPTRKPIPSRIVLQTEITPPTPEPKPDMPPIDSAARPPLLNLPSDLHPPQEGC